MDVSLSRLVRRTIALTCSTAAAVVLASPVSPPTASAADAAYCGAAVPKSTGGYWTCTFADEFSGWQLDTTKWTPLTTAGSGTGSPIECRVDSQRNINVGLGALRLTVRREPRPFVCQSPFGSYVTQFTAGAVTTYRTFSQAYGRFEIRAKFPAAKVKGLHSALWLWPKSMVYGAGSGEIDIAEFRTSHPDRVIPHLHYEQAVEDANITNYHCYVNRPEDYHLYTLEWQPGSLTILYDGQVCLQNTAWQPVGLVNPAPFDQEFVVNLNQSLGAGWNAYTSGLTPLPATMTVDYVRAWS